MGTSWRPWVGALLLGFLGVGGLAHARGAMAMKPVSLAFPTNDLSQYLRTERFDNVYAMLAGDGLCGLVDFRKNRILQLFAYGRFGTLQNLTYHVFYNEYYWLEGLHVYHATGTGDAVLYPFRCQSHPNDHAAEIGFDATRAEAKLRRVTLYTSPGGKAAGQCDWSARVEGARLVVEATLAPAGSEGGSTGLEGTLYPLYDRVLLDGEEKSIEYVARPGVLRGPWVGAKAVELRDSKGRLPRLRIAAEGGAVRYEAVQLTEKLAGARSLIFRAEAPGRAAKGPARCCDSMTKTAGW